MYIYYKRINHRRDYCEHCGRQGTKVQVVRWVVPGVASYVAGHNIKPIEYCSIKCAKAEEDPAKWVRVRKNTIEEINKMGYPA